MSKNVGIVRLLEPDQKTERSARVLLVQDRGQYTLCPVWRSAPNRLVPILQDKDGCMYIDASDPFSYELGSAPTLEQRIEEFNAIYVTKELPIKIVKIMTEDDLVRAKIPCYTKATEPDAEGMRRIPKIRMYV